MVFPSGSFSGRSKVIHQKQPFVGNFECCFSLTGPIFAAIKLIRMKKLIVILFVTGFMTACNSGSGTTKTDSAATAIDSTKMTDTASKMVDSTIKAVADTAKSKMNSIADSATKAIKK
jgi:hypothetical protein